MLRPCSLDQTWSYASRLRFRRLKGNIEPCAAQAFQTGRDALVEPLESNVNVCQEAGHERTLGRVPCAG